MQEKNYSDIINLPHHVSDRHIPMSRENRAAQFAPFAALTGYDDAVREAARLTEEKEKLSDEEKRILDMKLAILDEHASEKPQVSIRYFLPDERKTGGKYVCISVMLHKIDRAESALITMDKRRIPLSDIADIKSDIFKAISFD